MTKRAAHGAALSLLAFSAFTSVALVAWFARADEPWQWQTVIALASAALGLTTATLVWRAPSRVHVAAGFAVMVLSLVRIGSPASWTWSSFLLCVVTLLLAIPVGRAVIVLPP